MKSEELVQLLSAGREEHPVNRFEELIILSAFPNADHDQAPEPPVCWDESELYAG